MFTDYGKGINPDPTTDYSVWYTFGLGYNALRWGAGVRHPNNTRNFVFVDGHGEQIKEPIVPVTVPADTQVAYRKDLGLIDWPYAPIWPYP